jgi:group I intron endonuclease
VNCGIYAIEHVASGKMYVGSAIDFKARWRVHLCLLNKGAHHCAHLQAAWTKYGKGAFLFRKLLVCSPENLVMYEQRCIDGYMVCNREFGYNAAPVAGSQAGHKHSPETRAKIKAKRALQTFTAEQRANLWSPERHARRISTYGSKATATQIEARAKKLNFKIVGNIRNAYETGKHTQAALGRMFGISHSGIHRIVTGKGWIAT